MSRRRRKARSATMRTRGASLLLETLEPRVVLDGGPVINELMAVNASGLADQDGEHSDWIEIHNPTTAAINLDGWFLTDDVQQRAKWRLPGVELAADDYLIVFASGKDRANARGELHTNFKLDGDGEYLALVQPDAITTEHAFAPRYPDQFNDVSYGFIGDELLYFGNPTPGEANNAVGSFLGKVADTKFSVNRGFFDAPFELAITSATPDAVIRYTTDGSAPNIRNSTVYTGPITVSGTTTIRAMASKDGFLSTNLDTQTYVFPEDVLGQNAGSVPAHVNWGHAGPDWEVDPTIVNLPDNNPDRLRAGDLKSIPTISLVLPWNDMFGSNGIYIAGESDERATSFEYIDPSTGAQTQVNAAVQIQGGSSTDRWKIDKLSMRVKFKEEFGATKLNFPLFGEDATSSFDTIILDSVLNYSWAYGGGSSPLTQRGEALFVQDQYVADLHNALGGLSPHAKFSHIYINGVYWGMYYVHERPDHSFASSYFGGDKDDYDAIKHGPGNVNNDGAGGSATANYNAMLAAASAAGDSLQNWEQLRAVLDVESVIDYLLANWYTGNSDWHATKNWYATHGTPDGRWQFHSWDAEKVLENVNANNIGVSPGDVHNRLRNSLEYRTLFADRVQRAFFNGGALTPDGAVDYFMRRVNEIESGIRGESARWGDNHVTGAEPSEYRRSHWMGTVNDLVNNFFPRRSDIVMGQLTSAGLYPTVAAASFSQHGGAVPAGFPLEITGGSGTIYYTLDGSDPRLPGGALNPQAIEYTGPAALLTTGAVKARVLNSRGGWSALNEASFVVGAPTLVVTEINYNPHGASPDEPRFDNDDFEFIEIQNNGQFPVNLFGVRFTEGISFDFTNSAVNMLAPGERAVVVKNMEAFTARYGTDGINIAGVYSGKLDNGGERLRLADALNQTIENFHYNDESEWPERPDGNGSSLVRRRLNRAGDSAGDWRASIEYGGAPGQAPLELQSDVVVNEVMSRPLLDGGDAIELYNTAAADINIGGWFLSDSNSNYFKFTVPGDTILRAGEYLLFGESDFNPTPGEGSSFALDGVDGDDVWLLAADAQGKPWRFVDRVEFAGAPVGQTIGRWPNADGDMVRMSSPTLGHANSGPSFGPVVISEIQYNPTNESDDAALEFLELYNVSGAPVDLSDGFLSGVTFVFPAGTVIPAGGVLLLVSFDPNDASANAAFRAHYGISANVAMVGGYSGRLDNSGELVQLIVPDVEPREGGPRPTFLHDQVIYQDVFPWPESADGDGDSLHRRAADAFGAFADSWLAGEPTPGAVPFTPRLVGDANGDGRVDLEDLNAVRNNFGGSGAGDTNNDGRVDLEDLNNVRNNFGAMAAPAAVPAPLAAPTPDAAISSSRVETQRSRPPVDVVTAIAPLEASNTMRRLTTVATIAPDAAVAPEPRIKSVEVDQIFSKINERPVTIVATLSRTGELASKAARLAPHISQPLRPVVVDRLLSDAAVARDTSERTRLFRASRGHHIPPAEPTNLWDESLDAFGW